MESSEEAETFIHYSTFVVEIVTHRRKVKANCFFPLKDQFTIDMLLVYFSDLLLLCSILSEVLVMGNNITVKNTTSRELTAQGLIAFYEWIDIMKTNRF